MPLLGIMDVCAFVSRTPGAKGIVPIENSSGGTIHETVDILLNNCPRIHIAEELSLHVKLALLGHKTYPIKRLHSHFVPLEHCAPWIKKNLGRVEKKEESSTAISPMVAIPHIIVDSKNCFKLFLLKSEKGVDFGTTYDEVKAIFVLAGSRDQRHRHLKTLAAIAQLVQHRKFETVWQKARTEEQLKDVLLLGQRKREV